MALTNAFKEAVNSGNVRLVRIMMKDSLLVDPTFKEFTEMQNYAKSMPGLYDTYDGKELVNDKNLWNKEYMDKMMVQVVSDFSPERIENLKEVVRYLFPVKEQVPAEKAVQNNASVAGTETGESKADAQRTVSTPYENSGAQDNTGQQKQYNIRVLPKPEYRAAKVCAGAVGGGIVGGVITAAAKAAVGGVIAGIAIGGVVGGFLVAALTSGSKK